MAKGKYREWLEPEGLIKIEGWARDGLSDEQIAHNMGIARDTLIEWKKKYSDISDTLKRGKEVVDRQVENALLKRALGFEYTETTMERIADTGQKKRHDGIQELTEKEWELAKAYFGNTCCYCGSHEQLTKDHLQPLQHGGGMTFDNIVPACKRCNSSKKDRQWADWYSHAPFFDKERYRKIMEYIEFAAVFKSQLTASPSDLVVTKTVTKQVIPDTTAQIYWLKNRKPNVWRDRWEVVDNSAVEKLDEMLAEMKRQAKESVDKHDK